MGKPTIKEIRMLKNQRWFIVLVLGIGIGYAVAFVDFTSSPRTSAAPVEQSLAIAEPARNVNKDAVSSTDKPNIVFMMADNLGYGEVGCYGGGILRGRPRRASTSWPPKACVCSTTMSSRNAHPAVRRFSPGASPFVPAPCASTAAGRSTA